jgi:hypothetical protein
VAGTPLTGSSGSAPGAPNSLTAPGTKGASTAAAAEDFGLGYGCGGCSDDPATDAGGDATASAALFGEPWLGGTGILALGLVLLAGVFRRRGPM